MSRSKTMVVDQEENSEVSFVSRWSRRKHEAKRATEDIVTKNSATENTDTKSLATENAKGEAASLGEEQLSSTKILTDEDMPDIATMTADSDYSGFLSPGVSEKLRKLALRKLFHSEVFNIRDGLDEYDGDYTQFEKLGGIVTSDMKHQIEREAQRKAKQLLQDKKQLPDDTCLNDRGADDRDDSKDSTDENRVIAVNPDADKTLLDESPDITVAETGLEDLVLNPALSVNTGNENNIKNNMHKAEDNTELETVAEKNGLNKQVKNASQNHD